MASVWLSVPPVAGVRLRIVGRLEDVGPSLAGIRLRIVGRLEDVVPSVAGAGDAADAGLAIVSGGTDGKRVGRSASPPPPGTK